MNMKTMRHTIAATLSLLLALTTAFAAPASATDESTSMQGRIEAVIAEYGGIQTGWNQVSWGEGVAVLDLSVEQVEGAVSALAASTCASGRYCAYSGTSYGGNRLTYSACPASYTSFGALGGPVRSVKNSRSSGTVRAYANSTVVATLAPGAGDAIVSGVTKLTCS